MQRFSILVCLLSFVWFAGSAAAQADEVATGAGDAVASADAGAADAEPVEGAEPGTPAEPELPPLMVEARALKADLAEIGLETRLAEKGKQADLLLIDEVADYDSPLWYLSRLSCAYLDPCSEEVETLFKAARAARNVDERTDLLGKAEQSLMAQSLYIPLAMPVRFSLAREGLFGFEPNYRGWHLLQYLGDIPDRN